MELILISSSKLKVMLSQDDMSALSLTCEKLDYDNTETRRAFWQIFDEAKHKTGFDAASERIYVQVYPSKNGGCEMYVTKLSSEEGSSKSSGVSIKVKKRVQSAINRNLYCFETIDDLLCVCRQLDMLGYAEESSAYTDARGRYYLLLSVHTNEKSEKDIPLYPFVSEYAVKRSGGAVYPYINEYCSTIVQKEAVKELSVLSV